MHMLSRVVLNGYVGVNIEIWCDMCGCIWKLVWALLKRWGVLEKLLHIIGGILYMICDIWHNVCDI